MEDNSERATWSNWKEFVEFVWFFKYGSLVMSVFGHVNICRSSLLTLFFGFYIIKVLFEACIIFALHFRVIIR